MRITLVQIEIERIKFIVRSYVRTRVFKVCPPPSNPPSCLYSKRKDKKPDWKTGVWPLSVD